MATVQRLKSASEGIFEIAKLLYWILVLPSCLIPGVLLFIAAMSRGFHGTPGALYDDTHDMLILLFLLWLPVLVPLGLHIFGFRSRSKLLKGIVHSIKEKNAFWPEEGSEFYFVNAGKYMGIDSRNGTILYVHRIRKGQVDVVGLTMGDWTNRELEGNVLRLYTKYPDLPCIEIKTPWARRWYDTLGAMEYKRYSMSKPFAEYVRDHVTPLEREHQIHIPQVV